MIPYLFQEVVLERIRSVRPEADYGLALMFEYLKGLVRVPRRLFSVLLPRDPWQHVRSFRGEVAPADLELYQSHADLRHLSRLIWTHSAADIARCAGDLSRAQLSRRRRAMGPRCPEPTETVAVTLAMQAPCGFRGGGE